MTDDERAELRYYVTILVRIWTALSVIRKGKVGRLISVFRDVCSDKIRNMLHELAKKKKWTLGFSRAGNAKHQRLFDKLLEANKWFAEYKNRLHYRDCAGSHMQSLDRADHMFQTFGYKGEREWKHLTKGVAACVAMMRLLDNEPYRDFWRKIRRQVRGVPSDAIPAVIGGEHTMLDIPIEVEALLQAFKAPSP